MKKRIFKTIRKLPETNSSSSHTIVLGSAENPIDVSDLLRDDGKLHFAGDDYEFHWGWERFNDFETKVAYLIGLDDDAEEKVASVIEKVTGYESVFEYENTPSIDHQGRGDNYDILSDPERMKNFLFTESSWLFIGNDNGEAPKGFFDVPEIQNRKYPVAIATFEFPFGAMDFEIFNLENIQGELGDQLREDLPGEISFCGFGEDGDYIFFKDRKARDYYYNWRRANGYRKEWHPTEEEEKHLLHLTPKIWSDELGYIS